MRKTSILIIITFSLSLVSTKGLAVEDSNNKYVISGNINDAVSGESLIGATLYIQELKNGTVSNYYGFYSISLSPGKYTLVYSFIGYAPVTKEVNLTKDIVLQIELSPSAQNLSEVVVTGEAQNINITRTEMSIAKIDSKVIEKLPALMGEADVIKAMQLLPGVTTVSEGSSGFSVRGGGADQNLIVLDEAHVYNASHLMGFFSVFNNDAVKDLKLYKGDMPAEYGGRLSSVVDIRMKDGNMRNYSGKGSIGTISGKFTVEGPIWKDTTSFIISGRRTWADLFLLMSADENMRSNKLFFFDLNGKINHKFNDKNRVFVSAYYGRDIFKNDFADMGYGNATVTARWNHIFTQKLFSNATLTYSDYNYSMGATMEDIMGFTWSSGLTDMALKYDFGYYVTPNISLSYGIQGIFHSFAPGKIRASSTLVNIADFDMATKQAIELAAYISNEHKVTPLLTIKYGLRLSGFSNYNCDTVYVFDNTYKQTDSLNYGNKLYGKHAYFEPRVGFVYLLSELSSIKGAYSRNAQYLQLAQNTNAGTPLDIWFSASNNVKPQICDQFSLGYFRNFLDNKIEGSIEVFYKDMKNTIDFREFSNTYLNKKMEGELRYGVSYSYGAELLLRYNLKKLSGWVGYTYSRSFRKIKDINNGEKYNAPYDKPHDISIVANYEFNQRWTFAANWVYSTGNPVTYPVGKAIIAGQSIPIYTGRNQYRMPAYHRLDVSATLHNRKKPNKKIESNWNFSIYNAYYRKNVWAIHFRQDEDNPNQVKAYMTYLFPIIPSVTFTLQF